LNNPVLAKAGAIPDAEAAKRIAEGVWIPLYGAETIARQQPLQAELKFNVWIVTGSAPRRKRCSRLFFRQMAESFP
jgi:NTF2 fold immunity protein